MIVRIIFSLNILPESHHLVSKALGIITKLHAIHGQFLSNAPKSGV